MAIFRKYPQVAKFFMLLVLVAIFPFDGVFLLIADAAGIEAAFALVVVMFHPITTWLSPRVFFIKLTLRSLKRSMVNHKLNKPSVFVAHALVCSGVFVLSSSIVLATCIWLPALVVGGHWA